MYQESGLRKQNKQKKKRYSKQSLQENLIDINDVAINKTFFEFPFKTRKTQSF